MTRMNANKIDAARRLIDAAIRMLLAQEDPLAVYAIAQSGFNILRDLCEKNNGQGFYKELTANIRPGMEKKFWKELNKTWNFLKHADRDPDSSLENVSEELNEATLFMATQLYNDLGQKLTIEMWVVLFFVSAQHPDFILDSNPFKSFFQNLAEVRRMPRHEQLQYFNALLKLARSQSWGTSATAGARS